MCVPPCCLLVVVAAYPLLSLVVYFYGEAVNILLNLLGSWHHIGTKSKAFFFVFFFLFSLLPQKIAMGLGVRCELLKNSCES